MYAFAAANFPAWWPTTSCRGFVNVCITPFIYTKLHWCRCITQCSQIGLSSTIRFSSPGIQARRFIFMVQHGWIVATFKCPLQGIKPSMTPALELPPQKWMASSTTFMSCRMQSAGIQFYVPTAYIFWSGIDSNSNPALYFVYKALSEPEPGSSDSCTTSISHNIAMYHDSTSASLETQDKAPVISAPCHNASLLPSCNQ